MSALSKSSARRRRTQDEQFKDGLASAHLYLGTQQLDKGQNAEAERHLRQAVTLSEQDVDARLNLGRALHNLTRSVEAEEEFNRVIVLDPKAPLAAFIAAWCVKLGDLDAAIADLSEEAESCLSAQLLLARQSLPNERPPQRGIGRS